MHRGPAALATVIVVAFGSLGLASAASADDASVRAAGNSRDTQFVKLGKQSGKAFGAWAKSRYSRGKSLPLLRLLKRADRLEDVVTRAVRAQQPSTPTGAQAKRQLLLSNASLEEFLRLQQQGVRLATRRQLKAATAKFKAADRATKRSTRQAAAARKLFKQAGVAP